MGSFFDGDKDGRLTRAEFDNWMVKICHVSSPDRHKAWWRYICIAHLGAQYDSAQKECDELLLDIEDFAEFVLGRDQKTRMLKRFLQLSEMKNSASPYAHAPEVKRKITEGPAAPGRESPNPDQTSGGLEGASESDSDEEDNSTQASPAVPKTGDASSPVNDNDNREGVESISSASPKASPEVEKSPEEGGGGEEKEEKESAEDLEKKARERADAARASLPHVQATAKKLMVAKLLFRIAQSGDSQESVTTALLNEIRSEASVADPIKGALSSLASTSERVTLPGLMELFESLEINDDDAEIHGSKILKAIDKRATLRMHVSAHVFKEFAQPVEIKLHLTSSEEDMESFELLAIRKLNHVVIIEIDVNEFDMLTQKLVFEVRVGQNTISKEKMSFFEVLGSVEQQEMALKQDGQVVSSVIFHNVEATAASGHIEQKLLQRKMVSMRVHSSSSALVKLAMDAKVERSNRELPPEPFTKVRKKVERSFRGNYHIRWMRLFKGVIYYAPKSSYLDTKRKLDKLDKELRAKVKGGHPSEKQKLRNGIVAIHLLTINVVTKSSTGKGLVLLVKAEKDKEREFTFEPEDGKAAIFEQWSEAIKFHKQSLLEWMEKQAIQPASS